MSNPKPRRYNVIYADPPWTFATFSQKGKGRSPEAHYDCMSFRDLCAIPVGEFAAPDCALFLWATDPLLPRAIELAEAWGFKFKTVAFYWAKLNKSAERNQFSEGDFFTGLGYWTRANVEQCLLATRGTPKRVSKSVRRLIISPRREHSRKPDVTYDRLEQLMDGPYLEMFARNSRVGWDSWGNQDGLFDNGPVQTRRWASDLTRQVSA